MAVLPTGFAVEEGGYEIQNSLKFNSADSAYLSWTPASAGNRKTWTWSAWVKGLGNKSTDSSLFAAENGSDSASMIISHKNDTGGDAGQLQLWTNGNVPFMRTTASYRDPSAWYHIVWAMDTTQATESNRLKLYVNGVQVTSFSSATYPTLNQDVLINSANRHDIGNGNYLGSNIYMFAGYLTEVNFIDGQALDPTSFGETDSTTGVWKPKAYAGTYGTNGFYLPMTQDQIVEGFNTVLFKPNSGTTKVTGVGLSPDFVWLKKRNATENHYLMDSVRGGDKVLITNLTNAEASTTAITSFDADGFTVSDNLVTAGADYVGWCWDAGNSTVSNTDGTITSSVRASQTYGFSVITYTGNGSAGATIGHGLGVTPSFFVVKQRTGTADSWRVYSNQLGNTKFLNLDTTSAAGTSSALWNNTSPTSTLITLGADDSVNHSTWTYVCYAFAETGYSKFGSYTGNGSSTGPTVTLGWKPAFVLVKNASAAGYNWVIQDSTRDTQDPRQKKLEPNTSNAEDTTYDPLTFTDTGFNAASADAGTNASGTTYIYAAFKDVREAAFWRDFSGNGNHWQPNNLDFNDSVVDVPTQSGTDTGIGAEVRGNYCTWNPLAKSDNHTISNGNLTITSSSYGAACATLGAQSGKWYWEFAYTTRTATNSPVVGFGNENFNYRNPPSGYLGSDLNGGGINTITGTAQINATSTSYGSAISSGDLLMFAMDLDNRKFYIGKNGTWFNSGDPVAGTGQWPYSATITGTTFFPAVNMYQDTGTANFGQLPFAYAAPSGFKALCTTNLPDPAIADGSDYFTTNIWSGDGVQGRDITTGFSPDLVWVKQRNSARSNVLGDTVRGISKRLFSDSTSAESNDGGTIAAVTSDGYQVGSGSLANEVGGTYVGWSWRGSDATAVSNTDGSITSTVSANTTAGFSIVTYTGNGTGGATVGHGLGVAPGMIIVKIRSTTGGWFVWNQTMSNQAKLDLSSTDAIYNPGNGLYLNSTTPSSSVVTLGTSSYVNQSSATYVMYAFAPVEGYSAFGSYTGNGSADGPFVYTGFRPAFVLIKKTSGGTASHWRLTDSSRSTYNVTNQILSPSSSGAEFNETDFDFLSNGFKLRLNSTYSNGSGEEYIYMAFAENPFKYSLGR